MKNMKKKVYMRPAAQTVKMETCGMIAGSNQGVTGLPLEEPNGFVFDGDGLTDDDLLR
jgi:hypothetical protein